MTRKMMFKIGLTIILGVGVILFYLVSIEDLHKGDPFAKLPTDAHLSFNPFNKENAVLPEGRIDTVLKEPLENWTHQYLAADERRNGVVDDKVINSEPVVSLKPLEKPPDENLQKWHSAFQDQQLLPVIQR